MSDDPKTEQPTQNGKTPAPNESNTPEESGGRNGPDPVRYGDWENKGKCVDF